MKFADPDKPMMVYVQKAFKFNEPAECRIVTGGLIRAIQTLCAFIDASEGDQQWRPEVYRYIFNDLFYNIHGGTGSEEEQRMHHSLEIISQLLGVRNAPKK